MTEFRAEAALFAIALTLAIAAASVTTVINLPDDSALAGTTALAQSHEHLASREPLLNER